MHEIVMEITSLIMENHGKIMEFCFLNICGNPAVQTQIRTYRISVLIWIQTVSHSASVSVRNSFLKIYFEKSQ